MNYEGLHRSILGNNKLASTIIMGKSVALLEVSVTETTRYAPLVLGTVPDT